ncbi:hypothetical protein [Streptomyces sp. NPDC056144]
MSAVRKTFAVLATTVLMSMAFAGTSEAATSDCEWWFDPSSFYCQKY